MGSRRHTSVRVSPSERSLLEAAAQHAHTNLNVFIRRKAIEAAEIDMLDRRTVTIPAEHWESFEAWVNAPARNIPALQKLSAAQPAWQE